MKPSFFSRLRRLILCRIGIHYDAQCGDLRSGNAFMCCYDCGLLRHAPTAMPAERKTLIQRADGSWTTVAVHRLGTPAA